MQNHLKSGCRTSMLSTKGSIPPNSRTGRIRQESKERFGGSLPGTVSTFGFGDLALGWELFG